MTLEQHRVRLAWDATTAYAITEATKTAWKTAIMGLGTNVHRCGLLQAMAFLRRDDEDIYNAVAAPLRRHLIQRGFLRADAHLDLMTVARELSAVDYMLVSREVLAAAVWFKRAAQILCSAAN